MGEQLEIRTLGGLSVQIGNHPVSGFDSRKALALLVYLACTGRSVPREVLAEMLWDERSQAQAQSNLRVTLHSLNHTVGEYVEITRETVGLNTACPIWLDACEMERRLVEAERSSTDGTLSCQAIDLLESIRVLYQGDFLEGFHLDSQGFTHWSLLERERLRFSIIYTLDRLAEEYTRQHNTRAGMDCISRLVQIDSLREKTYRQAMRLLAQSGQREAAMHQYDTCQRILKEELGLTPSQETVDLYERIRSGQID